ncbi:hypothetical protein ACFVWR_01660 [Leifsonia sp. NPDC058292]|uniref:hypothetical protein n=1 Tax=Leifsonia sp. NPDC058292 TaxID=3346428 RepID=UPI0036D9C8BF
MPAATRALLRTSRLLVAVSIVFAVGAAICVIVPVANYPDARTSYLFAGSLSTGLAQLLSAPTVTFALVSAVGAVVLRAIAWEGRSPVERRPVRPPREP